MNYVEKEIDDVLQRIGAPSTSILKLNDDQAAVVVKKAQDTLVVGNPRVWWLSLRHPRTTRYFPDDSGSDHILEYAPDATDRCWFIPETGEEPLPVYNAQIEFVPTLTAECFFFEYNVVSHDFDWILIENEHKEIIFSKVPENEAKPQNDGR